MWYKLTFAVQMSPMSTRREISLAKDLIRHFVWKKAPARRHFLVFVFVYHGTTDPTSK